VFIAEKKRMVHDGTKPNEAGWSLNRLIDNSVFEIENPDTTCLANACADLAGWQCAFVVDVKGAYRSINVHPSMAYLCGFCVRGKVYVSTGLCFGIKSAGFLWGQVASLLQFILYDQLGRVLGHKNVRVEKYGDDFMVLLREWSMVPTAIPVFWDTIKTVGARLSMHKCQLGPHPVYTGILCNLSLSVTQVRPDRLDSIVASIHMLQSAAVSGPVCRKKLDSLIGKYTYIASQQLESGKACLASLYRAINAHHNSVVWLGQDSIEDLDLMARLLQLNQSRAHLPPNVHYLYTDASGCDGAGGFLIRLGEPVLYCHFGFPAHLHLTEAGKIELSRIDSGGQRASSTLLELAALTIALATFAPFCRECMVVCVTDSQAGEGAITRMYSPGKWSAQFLKAISCVASTHKIAVRVTQVGRSFVQAADFLSHEDVPAFKANVGLKTADHATPIPAGLTELLLSSCPPTRAVSQFFLG
jgi:ribonuclease HI